ncbi:MAG: hypothetical protein HUN05_12510 [Desulfobacter sp.]|nr:MAG: hypothetical protein HUN05_12510 [Desulfobacter sp.]
MSQHTISFKIVYCDTQSAAAAVRGLRHLKNGYAYEIKTYFEKQYNIHEIDERLLDCYNYELSRRKNIIDGAMDTDAYETFESFKDLLTETGALTLELVFCHDETGEEIEYKFDNHDVNGPALPQEKPTQVIYTDLDEITLQKTVYRAIYTMDIKTINAIYNSGIDINHRFENGETALMKAASYKRKTDKSLALIQTLLEYGADVNARSDYHDLALFNAFEVCNLPVIKLLVDSGTNLETEWVGAAENILDLFANSMEGEGLIEKESQYLEILEYLKGQGQSVASYFDPPLSLKYDGAGYNSLLRSIAAYDLMDLLNFLVNEGIPLEKLAYILYRSQNCRAADFIRKKGRGIIDSQINSIDRKIAREKEVDDMVQAAKKALAKERYQKVIDLLVPLEKSKELWEYHTTLIDRAREKIEEIHRKTVPESQATHRFNLRFCRPGKGCFLSATAHVDLVWAIKTGFDFHAAEIRAIDHSGWDMGLDGLDHLQALVYCRPPFDKGIHSGFHFSIDRYGILSIGKIETALSQALSTPAIYFKKMTVSCQGIEIRFKAAEAFTPKELPAFEKTDIGRKLGEYFKKSTGQAPLVSLQAISG